MRRAHTVAHASAYAKRGNRVGALHRFAGGKLRYASGTAPEAASCPQEGAGRAGSLPGFDRPGPPHAAISE